LERRQVAHPANREVDLDAVLAERRHPAGPRSPAQSDPPTNLHETVPGSRSSLLFK
jgi:hypothetical protein